MARISIICLKMKTLHFETCFFFRVLCVVTLRSAAVNLGTVRQSVTVYCSLLWATGNKKYFCKGTCSGKDILIETTLDNHQNGRYRIKDTRKSVFYVTIMDLKKTDSGQYWCGVDRSIKDSYQEVNIQVHEAPTSVQPTVVTSEPTIFTYLSSLSFSMSSTTALPTRPHNTLLPSSTSPVLYVTGGLVAMVSLAGLALLQLFRWRSRGPPVIMSSLSDEDFKFDLKSESEAFYQEIRDVKPGFLPRIDSTVYSTVSSVGQVSDSQLCTMYASIRFPKDSKDSNYQTAELHEQLSSTQTRSDGDFHEDAGVSLTSSTGNPPVLVPEENFYSTSQLPTSDVDIISLQARSSSAIIYSTVKL